MARTLSGSNDFDKLEDLANKTYKEQAVWLLNAFWEDFGQTNAEKVWNYVTKCNELDLQKKSEGCSLDELNAHRLLEAFNETMTVRAMRESLRSTGAIGDRVKNVPLIHFLITRFGADWHVLVNAPQGSQEEIDKAQAMLNEVNAAFAEADARDREAAAALAEARRTEAEAKRQESEAKAREAEAKEREAEALTAETEAKQRENDARLKEDELRAAKEELEAALAELKAQEDEYNNRTEQLKRASEEGGLVSRNRAKNELAQHLGSDPLPLRRAKITQEAAVNKADKATRAAEEAANQASQARASAENAANQASQARAAAEEAARQASQARAAAEDASRRAAEAKQAAEAAVEEARARVEEAEAYLEEVKARLPHGSTWWMERELYEAKKYLPKSRGGVDK